VVYEGTTLLTSSVATIRQLNLLGGQYLGLEFGPPDAPILPPDSEVRSMQSTNIDELITRLDRNQQVLFDKFTSIVDKVDRGQGLIGKLINDDALYDDLQISVSSLARITSRLEQGGAADNLSRVLSNLTAITNRVQKGEGTLGRLLTDEQVYDSLQNSLANLESITQKANDSDGLISKLLNDADIYEDLKQTVTSLRKIADRVESGEGALGKLINDPDLYYDAKTTLNKLEKAADGMSNTGTISAIGTVTGVLF
jgi:phospholipid/cholesterol/gamma-HCH transport system substrate-binding protein